MDSARWIQSFTYLMLYRYFNLPITPVDLRYHNHLQLDCLILCHGGAEQFTATIQYGKHNLAQSLKLVRFSILEQSNK